MAKRLYVGNLPFSVTSADLRDLFAAHGTVQSAQVQVDQLTGKGRGFGFVVMEDDIEAAAAIDLLDGTDYRDRRLNVNEAQAKAPLLPPRRGFDRGPGPGRSGPIPGSRSGKRN